MDNYKPKALYYSVRIEEGMHFLIIVHFSIFPIKVLDLAVAYKHCDVLQRVKVNDLIKDATKLYENPTSFVKRMCQKV